MNILPLIFVFLTILSLLSYTFLHERMASHTELKGYRGFMRVERLARNRLESKRFQQMPSQTLPQNTTRQPRPPSPSFSTFTSHRFSQSEASRLNISLLFSPTSPQFLYDTTAKLFKILYGHTDFFKTDLEYQLVDALCQACEGRTPPNSFQELFTLLPAHRDIFYKMIRGTNYYDTRLQLGYPPLEDFFALTSKQGKVCFQFPYASEPLLRALWGNEITEEIIAVEQKKWEKDSFRHTLLENDLLPLFKPNAPWPPSQIKENISYSLKRPKRQKIKHTDTSTHITVKKDP